MTAIFWEFDRKINTNRENKGSLGISASKAEPLGTSRTHHSGVLHHMRRRLSPLLDFTCFSACVRSVSEVCVMLSGSGPVCASEWVCVRSWTARYCLLWSGSSCRHQPVAKPPFLPCVTSSFPLGLGGQALVSSWDYGCKYFSLNFEELLCASCTRRTTREAVHHGSGALIRTRCVSQWCWAKWRL